jgi:hypothetical protein
MGFNLSPSVDFSEIDLTGVIPQVGTTGGAFAGTYKWGPVNQVVLIDAENTLVDTFGKPDNDTAISFFTAANFLAYGNNLKIVRVVSTAAKNATADAAGLLIKNRDIYDAQYSGGEGSVGNWAAKFPGDLGNSVTVSIADAGNFVNWAYATHFRGAPNTSDYVSGNGGSNDELHVIVIDKLGKWSGTVGTILEAFSYVSKASDAKTSDGASNYYADVVNRKSKYVYWMDHCTAGTNWGSVSSTAFKTLATTIVFPASGTGSVSGGPFVAGETVFRWRAASAQRQRRRL